MADVPSPKPFYRSCLFWLGLPGMMFLCWLWLGMSGREVTLAASVPYAYSIWMNVGNGSLIIQDMDFPPSSSGPWQWHWGEEKVPKQVHPMKIGTLPWKPGATRSRYVVVSFWLLAAIYAAGCVCACRWWQRRKARLLKASVAPPP